jgi:hypothetical protein
MSRRVTALLFGALSLAGVIAVLVAAAADQRERAFSLDTPTNIPAGSLAPRATGCQGPVPVLVAFKGIQTWFAVAAPTTLAITVRSPRGRPLARGTIAGRPAQPLPVTAALDAGVAAGQDVDLCLTNRGGAPATLLGSTATPESGTLTIGPKNTGAAFAAVLLRAHPKTLLSLAGTVFSRASLFKASWIGAWTFWVLCVAVLGAFGLVAYALLRAEDPESRDRDRDPMSATSTEATRQ